MSDLDDTFETLKQELAGDELLTQLNLAANPACWVAVDRIKELQEELACYRDPQDTYRWNAPDGTTYCCGGHWAKQVAWPEIQELERQLEEIHDQLGPYDTVNEAIEAARRRRPNGGLPTERTK